MAHLKNTDKFSVFFFSMYCIFRVFGCQKKGLQCCFCMTDRIKVVLLLNKGMELVSYFVERLATIFFPQIYKDEIEVFMVFS